MINLDALYDEPVPFADYMPFDIDDDKTYRTQANDPAGDLDPNADIKGKKLTPFGHLDKKNLTGIIKTSNSNKLDLNEKNIDSVDVLVTRHMRHALQNCTLRARRLMEKYKDKNSGLY